MKNIKVKKINKKKIVIISIVLVAIILVTVVICLVTKKDENVEVENTGRIQKQAMNPNNYTMVKSKDGIDVPVPKGYTASSVESESYVYEGTEEVTDRNQWTAQCERNQWVWIPIEDVSDMYRKNKLVSRI